MQARLAETSGNSLFDSDEQLIQSAPDWIRENSINGR